MLETALVLIDINTTTKSIEVTEESFAIGSEQAKKAKQKEKELLSFAKTQDYKIICKGQVIYDPETKVNHSNQEVLNVIWEQKEKEYEEKQRKLFEIKRKDLTELTEDEIVLLAESRVHGDHFTYKGMPALGTPTTFEGEYQKIIAAIEQKKSGKRNSH